MVNYLFPTAFAVVAALTICTHAHSENASKADRGQTPAIVSVPAEEVLKYRVLWDQECLYNHNFYGLRIRSRTFIGGEMIKFFYGEGESLLAVTPRANSQTTMTAMAQIPIRKGKVHGKVRRWAPDGTLLLEVPFVDGKIHGKCRFYSMKGKLLGTSTLEKGTGLYTVWSAYSEQPTVSRRIEYRDGKVVTMRE
ncbi:MAG: hypothetical protein COA78_22395 [Blastopirellula sp.]|nr:MAG: hypothetical protein COA78_22395 [Blastopirellula sp.]